MRVIFSRKGFDSAAGGCPSPIVDGRPISLPIPASQRSNIRYQDLHDGIGELTVTLTRGRISADSLCHLDPDIATERLPNRHAGWRGAFGQVDKAQTHLARQGVQVDDLFLFFGLFRDAVRDRSGNWRFDRERGPEHRIFGWLQIGEIIRLGGKGSEVLSSHPWLEDHPHTQDGWPYANNTLYVAREYLSLPGCEHTLPGWGEFRSGYRLTAPDRSTSVWQVPSWMDRTQGGCGLSWHPPARWLGGGLLQSVGRGQEFVADIDAHPEALQWIAGLWGN